MPVSPASFLGHGYCSSDSWFVRISTGMLNSNMDGPFYPNALGHLVTAKALCSAVCPTIATTAECEFTIQSADSKP